MLNERSCALISALAISALSLAACTSDSAMPGTPSEPARQATTATNNLSDILHQMSSGGLPGAYSVSLATSESGVAKTMIDPSECSYNSGINGFACPQFAIAGVPHTLSFWLYDADGASQQTLDMSDVASVRLVMDYAGTETINGTQDGLTGHTDLTMSGLLTATHTLVGGSIAGEDISDGSLTHLVSSMHSSANLSIPAGVNVYPVGGSVDITYHTTGPTSIDGQSQITFTGAAFAKYTTKMVKDGTTSSSSCTIDLNSGLVSC